MVHADPEEEFEEWGGFQSQSVQGDTSEDEGGRPYLDCPQAIAEASVTELQAAISVALAAASRTESPFEAAPKPGPTEDAATKESEATYDVGDSILACMNSLTGQGGLGTKLSPASSLVYMFNPIGPPDIVETSAAVQPAVPRPAKKAAVAPASLANAKAGEACQDPVAHPKSKTARAARTSRGKHAAVPTPATPATNPAARVSEATERIPEHPGMVGSRRVTTEPSMAPTANGSSGRARRETKPSRRAAGLNE